MLAAVKLPVGFHLFSALLRHIILYYVVTPPGLVARQTDLSLPQMGRGVEHAGMRENLPQEMNGAVSVNSVISLL